jgi:hypothetical protein
MAGEYVTTADFKAYALPERGTDSNDDDVITAIIEGVSRGIDQICHRRFYCDTADETRVYDTPKDRIAGVLYLDTDLLSITTLTNGDGSVITSGQYVLEPYNTTPKFAIKIRPTVAVAWRDNGGDTLGAISVQGQFAYSSTPPAAVREACKIWAKNEYKSRFGDNSGGMVQVTAAGVVITPESIPQAAYMKLSGLIKPVFG